MFFKKETVIFLLSILLFFSGLISTAYADYQGTIGTGFAITGEGFGTKKPGVYLQYETKPGVFKKASAKVLSYNDTSISCLWTVKVPAGKYDLFVKPNIKGSSPILVGTFSIMNPIIDDVNPNNGIAGDKITIKGWFFSTKKPKVFLQDPATLKKKSCKVLSYTMDRESGDSSLQFVIPKWGLDSYNLILINVVGQVPKKFPYYITVIPSTTKPADNETGTNLVAFSNDGTFTFSQNTTQLQSLNTGDIIAVGITNTTPTGALRKVTSISTSGNQTIVQTTPAILEEAMQSGSVIVTGTLSPDEIKEASIAKGVSLKKSKVRDQSIGNFEIKIDDVVIYDADKDPETTDDQVKLNGSISVEPSFDFKVKIEDWQLKEASFTQTTPLKFEISVASETSIDIVDKKKEIARYVFNSIIVWAGPVPIVITPILSINVGLDGSVSYGAFTSINDEASYTAGLVYDNGQWSHISSFSNTFNFIPPTPSLACTFKGYVGPELSLLVDGIIGPFARIEGYSKFHVAPMENPWWKLYAGLNADLGIEFEILSHVIAKYENTVIDYELLIKQADGILIDTTPPSVPTNLSATAASSSQINLSWDASTDIVGVTGYKIYNGGAYLKSVTGTTTSDTGLSPSINYCYKVSAYDAANNESGQSSQSCATTQAGADTTPPSVPQNLSATAASSSRINLSWGASTDIVGVTGYKIYKGGAYLKSVTGKTTSDTELSPSINYCYKVSAYDAANNESGQSSQSCATTQADTVPPSVPQNLSATAASSSQINLSWDASTDIIGVTGYKIYKGGAYLKSVTGTTTSDTELSPSINYCYKVSAYDAANNESGQSSQSCATTQAVPDTAPPSVPTNLSATAASSSQINLSWDASTDIIGVTGYKIYKGGAYLKSVTGTTTSDTGLSPSINYCYKVSAYDAANNESGQSSQSCATTQAVPDTTPPSVPTNLSATAASSSRISLLWDASTDIIGVTGYKIYKGGAYLKSVTGITTSDTGLSPSTNYCYKVAAYDAANNESGQSSQVCATTDCITGTWGSLDTNIHMTLTQDGASVNGTWINNSTGCSYNGTGTYNATAHTIQVTFTTTMDPMQCCNRFSYSGTVDSCSSMSLNWSNDCSFSGNRQY